MAPQPVAQPQVVYTTNAAPVVMVPGAPVVYPQMQAVPVQGVPMQGEYNCNYDRSMCHVSVNVHSRAT